MEAHEEPAIPIPEIFWSFETGKPLEQCSLCGCRLLEPGTPYLIEKAFRGSEVIFEHALCLDCHAASQQSLSQTSRERVRDYFAARVDPAERFRVLTEQHGTDHEAWISHCMVKGFPVREVDEYQLYGFCLGGELLFNGAPYVLCGEVIDEIIDLLSAETLGVLGELSNKLFGMDAPKDLLVI